MWGLIIWVNRNYLSAISREMMIAKCAGRWFSLVNIQQTHGDWLSRFQIAKFDLDSHIVQEICDLFSWLVAVYWVNCHFQAMKITTVMNNSWDSNCQNQLLDVLLFLAWCNCYFGEWKIQSTNTRNTWKHSMRHLEHRLLRCWFGDGRRPLSRNWKRTHVGAVLRKLWKLCASGPQTNREKTHGLL